MKLPMIMEIGSKVKNAFNLCLAKVSVFMSVSVLAVSAHADYDFGTLVDEEGQSAEEVADNITNVMEIVFGIIKGIAVLVGLWLVYSGIMRIKKANEPNSQTTATTGILFILLGGCLGALPFIFLSSAGIIQG